MMGFQSDAMKFAHFFFLCEGVVLAGTSLLIFCGCIAKDFEGANNFATVFLCLFMMLGPGWYSKRGAAGPRPNDVYLCRFDGHYINNKSIPKGARWVEELNFMNWAISARGRAVVDSGSSPLPIIRVAASPPPRPRAFP